VLYNARAMKRIRRWVFNGLAAVSLLLFLATVGLWVRSFWVAEDLDQFRYWTTATGVEYIRRGFWDGRGRVALYWGSGRTPPATGWTRWIASLSQEKPYLKYRQFSPTNNYPLLSPEKTMTHALGFGYYESPPVGTGNFRGVKRAVTVPFYALAAATSILPLFWVRSRWQRQRRFRDVCKCCGYDLRATPDRCPECGTVPANHKNSK